jgi:two-component system sensor histidine kinase UhpB
MSLRRRVVTSTAVTALLATVVAVTLVRTDRTIRSVLDSHESALTLVQSAEAVRRLVGEAGRTREPESLATLETGIGRLATLVDSRTGPTSATAGLQRGVAFDARRLSDLVRLLSSDGTDAMPGSRSEARGEVIEELDIELARLAGDVMMWNTLELHQLRRSLVRASRTAALALLLLAVTSVVVVWSLHRRVVSGLHNLQLAARAVSAGDLAYRIPIRSRDEFSAVADGFNRMVEERAQAAASLTASEERLRLALSAANQGLYDIDVQTGAMTVSPEYCRMIGYDPDELTETVAKLHQRLHPDDREGVVQAYQDFVAGRRSDFAVEFRQRTAHGGFRWVLSVGRIVAWDAEGRAVRMLGTHTDVTADREAQEALRVSREQLRHLAVAQEAAREAERARVARELHDELGQALTGLKLDVVWLRDRLPEGDGPARGRAAEALSLVDTTVEAVRRVAAELRPAILDDIGLASAIPWQAREFARRSGTQVTVTGAETIPAIESGKATAVFRILQESLTNVARHSGATAVAIEIQADSDWLRLDISDNGTGIEFAGPERRRPLGILGMQERARAWEGTVAVTPQPDGGTRVRVLMPVRSGGAPGPAADGRA